MVSDVDHTFQQDRQLTCLHLRSPAAAVLGCNPAFLPDSDGVGHRDVRA